MSNIHAPTVPSGPTTNGITNGVKTGQTLPELQAKKENMEAELRALSGVLDSHGVNMNTPLTTPDGFPRADLDVAQIRTTRSRIIHLKNDYKALMSAIEAAVHAHFAHASSLPPPATNGINDASPISSSQRSNRPENSRPLYPPFAKVNSVSEGSPAAEAGLRAGDEIREFGYVNAGNHEGLRRVGDVVQGNEGREVVVKIVRVVVGEARREELILRLVPKRWEGRGLLGCHILPI